MNTQMTDVPGWVTLYRSDCRNGNELGTASWLMAGLMTSVASKTPDTLDRWNNRGVNVNARTSARCTVNNMQFYSPLFSSKEQTRWRLRRPSSSRLRRRQYTKPNPVGLWVLRVNSDNTKFGSICALSADLVKKVYRTRSSRTRCQKVPGYLRQRNEGNWKRLVDLFVCVSVCLSVYTSWRRYAL